MTNGSNLLLTIWSSSIKIKTNDYLLNKTGLSKNNTVKEVKQKIFDLCQIPKHRQLLYSMFDHRKQYMRNDTCLLSRYNLINGCADILPPKIEQLTIQLGTGKKFIVNIDVGKPVSSIKSIIQNYEGIDIGCQILMKRNNVDQLKDQDLIVDVIDTTKPLFVKILLSGRIDVNVTATH